MNAHGGVFINIGLAGQEIFVTPSHRKKNRSQLKEKMLSFQFSNVARARGLNVAVLTPRVVHKERILQLYPPSTPILGPFNILSFRETNYSRFPTSYSL